MAIQEKGLPGMRFRRRQKNWTQAQLAALFFDLPEDEITTYHQVQMSRYENGQRWPSRDSLEKLGKVLGCDVPDLFTGTSHLARYVADQIADSREQYSRTNWDYYKGRESAFKAVLKALGMSSPPPGSSRDQLI